MTVKEALQYAQPYLLKSAEDEIRKLTLPNDPPPESTPELEDGSECGREGSNPDQSSKV